MKDHHKNKCKKACRHIHFGSTFLTAIFHFIFCGLPAIIALFGAILGLSSSPSLSFISSTTRGYLLIIGGLLILTSFIAYYKEKGPCHDPKMRAIEKIILYISLGFFSTGVVFHLISLATLTTPACH
jgi:uncharacterized membrane protein